MSEEFDWDAHQADVPIRTQMAIAVYRNPADDIVIRQERRDGQDEDQFIVIQPENLPALIEALQAEISNGAPSASVVRPLKPGQSTAA